MLLTHIRQTMPASTRLTLCRHASGSVGAVVLCFELNANAEQAYNVHHAHHLSLAY